MSVLSDPEIRLKPGDLPEIPLPKGWSELTLHAVLHVISLARIALLNAHIWPDGPECDTLRLRAENDRLKNEMRSYVSWYNEHRPHTRHFGRTPNEI